MALIYRKEPFWQDEKVMIHKIIYLLENAQSPAIARQIYKIRKNL
tara:strand:- start:1044 stop:1178 length:135 start_codon:yes stop_codon:yes gene_type:complete